MTYLDQELEKVQLNQPVAYMWFADSSKAFSVSVTLFSVHTMTFEVSTIES